MRSVLFAVFFLSFISLSAQDKYIPEKANVHFFSESPLENIEANNSDMRAVFDFSANTFVIKIKIKSFKFRNKLMEQHFNDNYLESNKYEYAFFKGKILGDYNLKNNGVYKIDAEGELDIHGVKKQRKIPVALTIRDGKISIDSKFDVKLADHNITIPSIVSKNIAEIIAVDITASLKKYITEKQE